MSMQKSLPHHYRGMKKSPKTTGRPEQTLPANKARVQSPQTISFPSHPNHIQRTKFPQKSLHLKAKVETGLVKSPGNLGTCPSPASLKNQRETWENNETREQVGLKTLRASSVCFRYRNTYWVNLRIQSNWFCYIPKYSSTSSYLNWKSGQIQGINHEEA